MISDTVTRSPCLQMFDVYVYIKLKKSNEIKNIQKYGVKETRYKSLKTP